MRHYYKGIYKLFLVITFAGSVGIPLTAQPKTALTSRIDGFNTVVFNPEFPESSSNSISIISGTPQDSFPSTLFRLPTNQPGYRSSFLQKKSTNSLLRVQIAGSLGSAVGDPLLNLFDNIRSNKDYSARLGIAGTFPYIPLSLNLAYRSLDDYPDHLTKKLQQLSDTSDFADEAIARELTTGYTLKGTSVITGLQTVSYKRWVLTPYYFSGIFSNGYSLFPFVAFALPNSRISANFRYDFHKDHYDNKTYTQYTDRIWDVTLNRRFTNGITATISERKNSTQFPSVSTYTSINDTIQKKLIWRMTGYIYSNFKPGGSAGFDFIRFPNIIYSLQTGWDYTPQAREYTFLENKKPVNYRTFEYQAKTLHTSLTYIDTLLFPACLGIWFDYNEKPLWESIHYAGDTNTIRQEVISNASLMNFGGKGSYAISYKKFSALLWGNASITPKNKNVHLSLPRNMGMDISWGRPDSDSLFAAIFIDNRARMSIKYLNRNADTVEEFTAPAYTRASARLNIPFFLPFVKRFIRTNFQIDAGPFNFGKNQYIREHPFGSPIGPAISVTLNALFH